MFIDKQLFRDTRATNEALVHADRGLTYDGLRFALAGLAHRLRKLNAGRGERVLILMERSVETVVAMYGVLASGACYVPLNVASPLPRLQSVVDATDPLIAIVDEAGEQALQTLRLPERTQLLRVRVADQDISPGVWTVRDGADAPPVVDNRSPDDPAYIIFTSGSTGHPKGVIISHRSLSTFVEGASSLVPFDGTTRYLNVTPLYFDGSVCDVYCTLSNGGTLVLLDRLLLPSDIPKSIERHRITATLLQSSVLKLLASRFVDLQQYDLSTMRVLWYGGETCPTSIVEKVMDAFDSPLVVHGYGPTETTHSATLHIFQRLPTPPPAVMPIGKPMPGVIARILDEEMQPVKPGEQGQLFIGGPQVMLGYCNAPERTAASLVELAGSDGNAQLFYKTGDYVSLNVEGDLEFHGRRDDIVKVRGVLLSMKEIEHAILTHGSVSDAFVTLEVSKDDAEHVLHAIIIPRPHMEPRLREISHAVRARCGAAAVPSHYHLITDDDLPRLAHGKLDLNRLKENVLSGASRSPQKEVETRA